MSEHILTPDYMLPVAELCRPVEVITAPEIVMKRDSDQVKTSAHFAGRTPYRLTVEFSRGQREKVTPDGQRHQVAVFDTQAVTVWVEGGLSVAPGQYVVLGGVMVGAVDGSTYVQATACGVFEPEKKG